MIISSSSTIPRRWSAVVASTIIILMLYSSTAAAAAMMLLRGVIFGPPVATSPSSGHDELLHECIITECFCFSPIYSKTTISCQRTTKRWCVKKLLPKKSCQTTGGTVNYVPLATYLSCNKVKVWIRVPLTTYLLIKSLGVSPLKSAQWLFNDDKKPDPSISYPIYGHKSLWP